MGKMKDIQIEILNSPALAYLLHKITLLEQEVSTLQKELYKQKNLLFPEPHSDPLPLLKSI